MDGRRWRGQLNNKKKGFITDEKSYRLILLDNYRVTCARVCRTSFSNTKLLLFRWRSGVGRNRFETRVIQIVLYFTFVFFLFPEPFLNNIIAGLRVSSRIRPVLPRYGSSRVITIFRHIENDIKVQISRWTRTRVSRYRYCALKTRRKEKRILWSPSSYSIQTRL